MPLFLLLNSSIWHNYQMTADFDGVIAIIALVVSAGVAVYSVQVARSNEKSEEKAERRRFFALIWDRFAPVSEIKPSDPNQVDVIYDINMFELIALSWMANVVDKEMVALAFGPKYDLICSQMETSHVKMPIGQTPAELLGAHRHIQTVRKEINALREKQTAITG